jgi:hypothetical protein
MDEAVTRLQGAFGKRTVERRHRVTQPDGTGADRVRYLVELCDLNDDLLHQASAITVPRAADQPLRDLFAVVRASTTLMRGFISDPSDDFDALVAQIESQERRLVSAFLGAIGAIDPSAVAVASREDRPAPD